MLKKIVVVKIESAYYDADETQLSKAKTMALFGPISTGMNFSTFNQHRKLEQQMKALGAFPWQAQRFSPYPAVASGHFEEIANLKEKLHESQMREKDTQIAFLKYQMQQQAMLTQQYLDSMKFLHPWADFFSDANDNVHANANENYECFEK